MFAPFPLTPPQIYTLKPNAQGDGVFGRWLGHESGALMNGVYTLKNEV